VGEAEYIIAAVYGQSISKAHQLIEESAENQPMKWHFVGSDNLLNSMWSCVKDEPVDETTLYNPPKIETHGQVVSSLEKLASAD
jgi:hypothetical protein